MQQPPQQQQTHSIAEAVDQACAACGLEDVTEAEVAEMTVSEVRFLATSPAVAWRRLPPFPRAVAPPAVPDMQVYQCQPRSALPSFVPSLPSLHILPICHLLPATTHTASCCCAATCGCR